MSNNQNQGASIEAALPSPPAPEHWYYCCGEAKPTDGYTLEQLYDYARAAIEADRAQLAMCQPQGAIYQPSGAMCQAEWITCPKCKGNNAGIGADGVENDCAKCENGMVRASHAAPASAQPADDVRTALQTIHDTFKRDLDQGYKTRDKEFAVSIAAEALGAQPDQRESAAVPVEVKTERGRVWIVRGSQSFMLAYEPDEGDDPAEMEAYADNLRAALSIFTHDVNSVSASPAAQPAKGEQTCIWTEHPEDGYWRTACGRDWVIIDGTPTDHDMNHCHGCGKKLVQAQDSANNSADKQKGGAE